MILILHVSFYAFSQEITMVDYQTLANSPLRKQQADTLSYMYKIKYYENSILKRVEYCLNKTDSTGNLKSHPSIIDYYLDKNEDVDIISKNYLENNESGPNVNFIKINKKEGYSMVYKLNEYKDVLGKRGVIKAHYILDNDNRIIALEENRIAENQSKKNISVKNLYDELGTIVMICGYIDDSCSVYSSKNMLPVETIKLKDFQYLKDKYFPFQNIDYYKNTTIEPPGVLNKIGKNENHSRIEFKTDIGTKTDAKKIALLDKYSKYHYQKNRLVKVEFFEKEKLVATDYYVNNKNQEDLTVLKHQGINTEYSIIKFEKRNLLEIKKYYKGTTFLGKTLKRKDVVGHVISEEYFDQNEKQHQYSKTRKRYYDANGLLVFESSYLNDGKLNQILLYNNEYLGIVTRFDRDEWIKFKKFFFPNEDIDFYKRASIN